MSKQFSFEDKGHAKPKDRFGGSLLKGNPKSKRPLESKLPIHLVLRSAQSRMRLPKYFLAVNRAVEQACKRHGVRLYECANVGNHLHLLIKIPARPRWSAFIRELTGRIAQAAQGLTAQDKASGKFWRYRPFTRIVRSWKKAYQTVKEYIHLNTLEAEGFISRKDTKTLKDLHAIWGDG